MKKNEKYDKMKKYEKNYLALKDHKIVIMLSLQAL